MCNESIAIELEKILTKQKSFKQEYVAMIKDAFNQGNKKIKMFILSTFLNHIQNDDSLALFDEDIFTIYKKIIDNYICFLNQIENNNFKFNDDVLKNLSGIISVLKSQVSFFCEEKHIDINPIYTEKKSITAKYLDNIYKDIDNLCNENFENTDLENVKDNFVNVCLDSYRQNLTVCFNAINDIENRKQISHFNDVLAEEIEILSSIIKLQITPLEKLCKYDEEKETIDALLMPIIEVYQQTGKSFDTLNNKIKNLDTNININFDEDNENIKKTILTFFENIKQPDQLCKEEAFVIFEKYIQHLKQNIIKQQQQNVDLTKAKIEKFLKLSNHIKSDFKNIEQYIGKNKTIYEKSQLYNIIQGIYESISIKVDNIQEKENETFLNKDKMYQNMEDSLKNLEDLKINYDFELIYEHLKNDTLQRIRAYTDFKNIQKDLEQSFVIYTKKLDDFLKNTILFEISTFQEIMYYSVVRLRESNEEPIKQFIKYIDSVEQNIENELTKNEIIIIKPNPHDMFDTKEHEVLIAEKNDDFLKGQIIKVINYGYKKKDNGVIKRATVIAAK